MSQAELKQTICRQFRQKTMHVGGIGPELERLEADSPTHCWCLHTQDAMGPDERRVEPRLCQPGRRCHQAY